MGGGEVGLECGWGEEVGLGWFGLGGESRMLKQLCETACFLMMRLGSKQ